MRVAAIGWARGDLEDVIEEADRSAIVTHSHPEGRRGARAVAAAVFVARRGEGKGAIDELLGGRFGYDCVTPLAAYWKLGGLFDVSCQGTVPRAAAAFRESDSWEDAVCNAVSLGGDTDTNACIVGAIAEAYYGGVPAAIQAEALARLKAPLLEEALACARAFGVPVHAPPDARDG
jgi:ADP-ribosylglycohydrolase